MSFCMGTLMWVTMFGIAVPLRSARVAADTEHAELLEKSPEPDDGPARRDWRSCSTAVQPPCGADPTRTRSTEVFIFLHVAKTSGTSLSGVIYNYSVRSGRSFCHVDPAPGNESASLALFQGAGANCDVLVGEFASLPALQQAAATAFPHRAARIGTMLRDPILRTISRYVHEHEKGRIPHDSPSGVSRYASPHSCSTQARPQDRICGEIDDPDTCGKGGYCGLFQETQTATLVGSQPEGEAGLDVAKANLQSLSFFGITEHYRASVCLFLHDFFPSHSGMFDLCCTAAAPPHDCDLFDFDERRETSMSIRDPDREIFHAGYMTPYLDSAETIRSVASGNRNDCALYAYGLELFFSRVRTMERETGLTFLRRDSPTRSNLCAEGLQQPYAPKAAFAFANPTEMQATPGGDDVLQGQPSADIFLVYFAIGPDVLKAFRSARSARQFSSPGTMIWLFTDAAGVLTARQFDRSRVFDRVRDAVGPGSELSNLTFDDTTGRGKSFVHQHDGAADATHMQGIGALRKSRILSTLAAVKQLPQGAPVLFLDADTFFCSGELLRQFAHEVAAGSDAVITKMSMPERRCQVLDTPEANGGLLGFRAGPVASQILSCWDETYRRSFDEMELLGCPTRHDAQKDQPSFAHCLHQAVVHGTARLSVLGEEFNCRPGTATTRGRVQELRQNPPICSLGPWASCQLIHQHGVSRMDPVGLWYPRTSPARLGSLPAPPAPHKHRAVLLSAPFVLAEPLLGRWRSAHGGGLAAHALDAEARAAWDLMTNRARKSVDLLHGPYTAFACRKSEDECLYLVSLRDPIRRLADELALCRAGQFAAQHCRDGASRLPGGGGGALANTSDAQRPGTSLAGVSLADWAEARGDVLLEYILPLTTADVAGSRSLPLSYVEARRQREGIATSADLAAIKHFLNTSLAFIGLADEPDMSTWLFEDALCGAAGATRGSNAAPSFCTDVSSRRPSFSASSVLSVLNRSAGWTQGITAKLSATDVERINAALALDLELFEFAAGLFERQVIAAAATMDQSLSEHPSPLGLSFGEQGQQALSRPVLIFMWLALLACSMMLQLRAGNRSAGATHRSELWDTAKFILMVIVIWRHMHIDVAGGDISTLGVIAGTKGMQTVVHSWVVTFHIPCFAMISGLFSKRSATASPQWCASVVEIYVVRIQVAIVMSLLSAACGEFPYGDSLGLWLYGYWKGWNDLWYLMALGWWRLTAPGWAMLRWPVATATVLLLCSSCSYFEAVGHHTRSVLLYLPYFVFGLSVDRGQLEEKMSNRTTWLASCLVNCAVFAIIQCSWAFGAPWLPALVSFVDPSRLMSDTASPSVLPLSLCVDAVRIMGFAAMAVSTLTCLLSLPSLPLVRLCGRRTLYAYVLQRVVMKWFVPVLHGAISNEFALGWAVFGLSPAIAACMTMLMTSSPAAKAFGWLVEPNWIGSMIRDVQVKVSSGSRGVGPAGDGPPPPGAGAMVPDGRNIDGAEPRTGGPKDEGGCTPGKMSGVTGSTSGAGAMVPDGRNIDGAEPRTGGRTPGKMSSDTGSTGTIEWLWNVLPILSLVGYVAAMALIGWQAFVAVAPAVAKAFVLSVMSHQVFFGGVKYAWMRSLGFDHAEIMEFASPRRVPVQDWLRKYGDGPVARCDGLCRKFPTVVRIFWEIVLLRQYMFHMPHVGRSLGAILSGYMFGLSIEALKLGLSLLALHSESLLAAAWNFSTTRVRDGHLRRRNHLLVHSSMGWGHVIMTSVWALFVVPRVHASLVHLTYALMWYPVYVGDGMAEIVGVFGSRKFPVSGAGEINVKTVEGCIGFAVSSAACSFCHLLICGICDPQWYAFASALAVCAMLVETLTPRGLDNFTLPVCAGALLAVFIRCSTSAQQVAGFAP